MPLCEATEILAELRCCVSLSNLSDWRQAVECRSDEWQILWIGHPWLSVRYECGLLILSEPHHSALPSKKWAATPNEVWRAIRQALGELETFAERVRPTMAAFVGDQTSRLTARSLAGLAE